MVCTNNARPLRDGAHAALARHGARAGLRRAASASMPTSHPDLNPDFIFAFPGYNVRSTEINAVIGRSQLKRLDEGNQRRHGEPAPVPRQPRSATRTAPISRRGKQQLRLHACPQRAESGAVRAGDGNAARARRRVPPRHSGGGNQLRQPYLRSLLGDRRVATSIPQPTTSISTASTSATTRRWNATTFCSCAAALNAASREPSGNVADAALNSRPLASACLDRHPGSRTAGLPVARAPSSSAVENPVWAGLMATFCRQGLSVADHRRRGGGADRRSEVPSAVADLNPGADRRRRLRPPAVGLDADHDRCRPGLHSDQQELSPNAEMLLVGGHVAALPERTCARRTPISSPPAKGLHTLVELVDALKTARSDFAKVPGLWYRAAMASRTHCASTAGAGSRRRDAGARLGPAADEAIPRPQLALPRRPRSASRTPRSTRRSAAPITASSAASRRRSRAAKEAAGWKATANSYRYWSPDAVVGADRNAGRRITASATSRSPTRCSS